MEQTLLIAPPAPEARVLWVSPTDGVAKVGVGDEIHEVKPGAEWAPPRMSVARRRVFETTARAALRAVEAA
jgi:hypothetical protein